MFSFAVRNSDDDGDEIGVAARVYSHITPIRKAA